MNIKMPDSFQTDAELDDFLSRPYAELSDFFQQLDGDLMIIGASGKTGPTITRMALRAVAASGKQRQVYALARSPMPALAAAGALTRQCDLLDWSAVEKLPRVENIIYLAGFKFGAEGAKSHSWAINTIVPYHVARHFQGSRIVSLSTGCVYPLMHLKSGGASEKTELAPVGEYAQSCLGRERMFDFFADQGKSQLVHIRLNYAVECRYGVLLDLASKIWCHEAIDLTTGYANVIWQGDAANHILLSLGETKTPAAVLNLTGPECFSIREVAGELAILLERPANFIGEENGYDSIKS